MNFNFSNLSRYIPRSRILKINLCFVVIVTGGLAWFVVAKQAVDKNRAAMMRTKQKIYEARLRDSEEIFGPYTKEADD